MSTRRDRIGAALAIIAPGVPPFERAAIIDHAEDSPGLRPASPQSAAWAALVAYVRHNCTDYDDLLADGYDAAAARHFVLPEIQRVLIQWGCRHPIPSGEQR